MKKVSRRNILKGLLGAPIVAASAAANFNPFDDNDDDTDAMREAKVPTRRQHEQPEQAVDTHTVAGITLASAWPGHGWTPPRTWASNEVVTASVFNQHLHANLELREDRDA